MAGADPLYNSVSLLLHFDGANNGTTFTDNAPSPVTLTGGNTTTGFTSTTGPLFGTACGQFIGNGVTATGLATPTAAAGGKWDMAALDWTFEVAINPTSVTTASSTIFQLGVGTTAASGVQISMKVGIVTALIYSSAAALLLTISAPAANKIVAGTYTRVAVIRQGNLIGLFQNGQQIAAGTLASSTVVLGTATVGYVARLATAAQATAWIGKLDELRLTKGVARYTVSASNASSYTVDAVAFGDALPTNYPASQTDAATAVDVPDSDADNTGTQTDAASGQESSNAMLAFMASTTETGSGQDTSASSAVLAATTAEATTAAESSSSISNPTAAQTDSGAATDSPATAFAPVAAVSEAATAADATTAPFAATVSQSDSGFGDAAQNGVLSLMAAQLDSAIASDSTSMAANNRSDVVEDNPTALDNPNSSNNAPVSTTESTTALDSDSGRVDSLGAVAEPATANNTVSSVSNPTATGFEQATNVDGTGNAMLSLLATQTDTGSSTDASIGVTNISAAVAELSNGQDSTTAALSAPVSTTETGAASNTQANTLSGVATVTETNTAMEWPQGWFSQVGTAVVEWTTANEWPSGTITATATQTDAASLTDAPTGWFMVQAAVSETGNADTADTVLMDKPMKRTETASAADAASATALLYSAALEDLGADTYLVGRVDSTATRTEATNSLDAFTNALSFAESMGEELTARASQDNAMDVSVLAAPDDTSATDSASNVAPLFGDMQDALNALDDVAGSNSLTAEQSDALTADSAQTLGSVDTQGSTYETATAVDTASSKRLTMADLNDPYYTSVSILLHMDGANGSTAFPDNSQAPINVTAQNAAKVVTDFPEFGTGALLTDGIGASLLSDPSQALDLPGDFTIEASVNPISAGGLQIICCTRPTNGDAGFMLFCTGNQVRFFAYDATASIFVDMITPSSVITNGTWAQVAVTRYGTSFYLFVNGQLQAFRNNVSTPMAGSYSQLAVGYDPTAPTTRCLNARVDEIRITKGVPRYTSTYTTATTAFPNATSASTYAALQAEAGLALDSTDAMGAAYFASASETGAALDVVTGNVPARAGAVFESAAALDVISAQSDAQPIGYYAGVNEGAYAFDRGLVPGNADITEFGLLDDVQTATVPPAFVELVESALAVDIGLDALPGTTPPYVEEHTDAGDDEMVVILNARAQMVEQGGAVEVVDAITGVVGDDTAAAPLGDDQQALVTLNFFAGCTETCTAMDAPNGLTYMVAGITETALLADTPTKALDAPVSNVAAATADSTSLVNPARFVVMEAEQATAFDAPTAASNQMRGVTELSNAQSMSITTNAPVADMSEPMTLTEQIDTVKAIFLQVIEFGAPDDILIGQAAANAAVFELSGNPQSFAGSDKAGYAGVFEVLTARERSVMVDDAEQSVLEQAMALDISAALLGLNWRAVLAETAAALDEEMGTIPYFKTADAPAKARERTSVTDLSGFEPGNPAVWRVEYRRRLWTIKGRK